jgi:hypothetical protein
VGIGVLAGGGSTSLCRNGAAAIAVCSSSLRYKTDILPFTGGLDLIQRLHPIAFRWKDGGMHDVGFGAEEVERVEPLLTTYNDKGEVEGVKYDRITAALVNTAQEQQAQIVQQQQQLELQKTQIEALKKLVCADHHEASICESN